MGEPLGGVALWEKTRSPKMCLWKGPWNFLSLLPSRPQAPPQTQQQAGWTETANVRNENRRPHSYCRLLSGTHSRKKMLTFTTEQHFLGAKTTFVFHVTSATLIWKCRKYERKHRQLWFQNYCILPSHKINSKASVCVKCCILFHLILQWIQAEQQLLLP